MGKTLKSYSEWRLQESLHEYSFYNKQFKRMLLTMFKWNGLPNEIPERFIEKQLYENGKVLFYKHRGGFYTVSKCTPSGTLNDYEEPLFWHAYHINGEHDTLIKSNECVVIYNDYLREGNAGNVNFFSKRISNVEKTIDVNLEQLKQPVIISTSEGQKKTAELLWQAKTNGQPVIFVDESAFEHISTNVMDLHITNHIPDLQDTKHEYINEALTFFGINNVNVIKKERLVTGEAEQNDEAIFLNLNTMLKARQEACEQINRMFPDLNVSVSVAHRNETGGNEDE